MDLTTITHKMTLSTTDFNLVGDVKVRQADEETQVFEVTILEHGLVKPFDGLRPFFCLMAREITGQGVSEEPVQVYDSSNGTLKYTLSANAFQMVGKNEAYFSFRSQTTNGRWIEQFSTKSFFYTVEKSIYTQPFKDSNYWFTFKELYQKFLDYQESGKISWEDFVADSKEIIESIDPNGMLFTKLQENKENIDSRGINVLLLGLKNDGETDNYALLTEVMSNLPDGSKLFFPEGEYILSDNFAFRKQVHIEGIKPLYENGNLLKGTVFNGGGIYFRKGSSGSTVKNLGVMNLNRPNGVDIREEISNISIDNCLTIARDHGILLESYTGLVRDIAVTNCQTFDGIHGFISKAKNVNFINCQANNHTSWGFGIISDNISGASNIGAAINNKISDCRSIKCGVAFSQYKRDYFGDGSTFECSRNQFSNCSAINCITPLSLGDPVGDTGGGKYTSYSVSETTITNFTESDSVNPIRIYQTDNLNISGLSLSQSMLMKRADNNLGPVITGVSGGKAGQIFDLLELDKSSSPSLDFGRYFRTNNSTKNIISDFSGGIDGETYEINLWDENTTIKGSSTVFLLGPSVSGRGSSIRFKYQDGVYFEVSRGMPMTRTLSTNYDNATNLDIANFEFIDLFGNGTKSNLIKLVSPERGFSVISILVRSSSGTFTFGGFDQTQFIAPSDIAKSVAFGTGLITQWAWLTAVGKYILISKNETKYT